MTLHTGLCCHRCAVDRKENIPDTVCCCAGVEAQATGTLPFVNCRCFSTVIHTGHVWLSTLNPIALNGIVALDNYLDHIRAWHGITEDEHQFFLFVQDELAPCTGVRIATRAQYWLDRGEGMPDKQRMLHRSYGSTGWPAARELPLARPMAVLRICCSGYWMSDEPVSSTALDSFIRWQTLGPENAKTPALWLPADALR